MCNVAILINVAYVSSISVDIFFLTRIETIQMYSHTEDEMDLISCTRCEKIFPNGLSVST